MAPPIEPDVLVSVLLDPVDPMDDPELEVPLDPDMLPLLPVPDPDVEPELPLCAWTPTASASAITATIDFIVPLLGHASAARAKCGDACGRTLRTSPPWGGGRGLERATATRECKRGLRECYCARMRALILIFALVATACASSSAGKPVEFTEPPTLEPEDFEAMGTLITWGNSVSYDHHRIVGPQVDVALQDGKEWAGSVYGHNVRLAIGAGELVGLGDKLVFRREGDTVHVEGRWAYRRVRIEVSPTHLVFRDGQRSYDLKTKMAGCLGDRERTGCMVKVQGDAAHLSDAAMPQFAIALIAAFPFAEER
jgi:hypothetical protein